MAAATILHVDMDAFYASVETIKDPTLRGRPLIVGGQDGRGVVTSASYEARAFGVHSAMPMVTARRLCPHAIFLPNDFNSYQDYSRRIAEVFARFTPLVEPLSLDEAFLDVSGSVRLFGPPTAIAHSIKEEIAALGLACTIGIAPNKFLAKLASTRAKPDGLLVVEEDRIEEFLHPLPAAALWGVGPQTAEALERLGLKTVGDIAGMPLVTLQRGLGDATGSHLWELARGIDERPVVPSEMPRSVGSEETFRRDLDSAEEILREILRLSDRTASRLRSKKLCGRTVTLKVRFSNFRTITRSHTSGRELDSGAEIYAAARRLYLGLHLERSRLRLLGVTVSGLVPGRARRQLDLLARDATPAWGEAAEAIDAIRGRFGEAAVGPATLLQQEGKYPNGLNDQGRRGSDRHGSPAPSSASPPGGIWSPEGGV
jgi:DNA polymerase IV